MALITLDGTTASNNGSFVPSITLLASWNVGDYVIVVVQSTSGGLAAPTVTNSNLTFSLVTDGTNSASAIEPNANMSVYMALAGSTQSAQTITITFASSENLIYGTTFNLKNVYQLTADTVTHAFNTSTGTIPTTPLTVSDYTQCLFCMGWQNPGYVLYSTPPSGFTNIDAGQSTYVGLLADYQSAQNSAGSLTIGSPGSVSSGASFTPYTTIIAISLFNTNYAPPTGRRRYAYSQVI